MGINTLPRDNLNDLLAFIAVARERSFTRAAAQVGVSQSALSHTIKGLEARLGVRLLTRTTRSVSPTEAGERLLERISPQFEQIEAELQELSQFREHPAGSLRISATDYTIQTVLWPRLVPFLRRYPDIRVELINDYGLADIVAQRCDAGVRLGEQLARDMIAVRISPDLRFALVGSKSYFARRPPPQAPHELVDHRCINLRLPTSGGLYAWEFGKDGQDMRVRVDGQLVFNDVYQILRAAVDGFGLAYIPEGMVQAHLDDGRLVRVLEDWSPMWTGYHLYYPNRRQPSPAMRLLVDALRYPPDGGPAADRPACVRHAGLDTEPAIAAS